jgi:hypothetical protein
MNLSKTKKYKNFVLIVAWMLIASMFFLFVVNYNHFLKVGGENYLLIWINLFFVLFISIIVIISAILLIKINNTANQEIVEFEKRISAQELIIESHKSANNSNIEKIDFEKSIKIFRDAFRNNNERFRFGDNLLISLSKVFPISIGLFWVKFDECKLKLEGNYAIRFEEDKFFDSNEGLVGQAYMNKDILTIGPLEEEYFNSFSGLGQSKPSYLSFIPVFLNNNIYAIIEIAYFKPIDNDLEALLRRISEIVSNEFITNPN